MSLKPLSIDKSMLRGFFVVLFSRGGFIKWGKRNDPIVGGIRRQLSEKYFANRRKSFVKIIIMGYNIKKQKWGVQSEKL